jgi:hypothetical protein
MRLLDNKLLSQFLYGAINGLILGFCCDIFLRLLINIDKYWNGDVSQNEVHIQTSSTEIPYFYLPFLGFIVVGISKCFLYVFFKIYENSFINWQIVGFTSIVIFYISCLVSNVVDSILFPTTYQWKFSESLNASLWILMIVIVSIFNSVYAVGLNVDFRKRITR